jgi:hypothetical protein
MKSPALAAGTDFAAAAPMASVDIEGTYIFTQSVKIAAANEPYITLAILA